VPLEKFEELLLQLGPRAVAGFADRLDQPCAPTARDRVNDSIDGSHVELVGVFRLGDHPPQCLAFEHVREIEQGPRNGRDRDPVPNGYLVRPQPA
jgi:hypothetical protein